MNDNQQAAPFFLIFTDHDRRVFSIEGPMTDAGPWNEAATAAASNYARRISCDPSGPQRDALAAGYQAERSLAGVPPGSIVRPRLPENLPAQC